MAHVEFLGAMGSGKSTLYKACLRELRGQALSGRLACSGARLAPEALYGDIAARGHPRWLAFRLLYHLPALRNRFFTPDDIAEHFGISEECTALVDWILSHYRGVPGDAYRSLRRFSLFLDTLAQFTAINARVKNDTLPIFDEFLLQRGLAFALFQPDQASFIHGYLERAPVASLVVYIDTPFDMALARARSRTKSSLMPDSVMRQTYEAQQYMLDILGERQRPVLRVDGRLEIEDNVQRILARLKALSVSPSGA